MSGTVSDEPPDWSRVGTTVELQIRPDDPWSLRAYAIPHRGELYVPSFFAERRRWVPVALGDARALVRIGDRLFPRKIERIEDASLRSELIVAMAEHHGYEPEGVIGLDTTWYFRLGPPVDPEAIR